MGPLPAWREAPSLAMSFLEFLFLAWPSLPQTRLKFPPDFSRDLLRPSSFLTLFLTLFLTATRAGPGTMCSGSSAVRAGTVRSHLGDV
jgi:hypothetical protein